MRASVLLLASVSVCGALLAIPGCPPETSGSIRLTPVSGTPLESAIVLLQVEARSKDPDIRANCVEALQPLGDERALDVISQGLHDEDWLVRFASAMAAGGRKALSVKPILQGLATKDPNDNVQVAAIYAMARLGDTTYMNHLAETLSSPDAGVRANTALALGLLGDRSAIPLLLSHSREAEPRAKFEIAAALARLGDQNGIATLEGFSESRYFEDRMFVMTTWADVADPHQADVLLSGLQDPMPGQKNPTPETLLMSARIRLAAARGLGKLGNRAGLKGAKLLADDASPELRAQAALALGDILYPSEQNILTDMMRDPDERVRLAAAAAIVELNTLPRPVTWGAAGPR